MKLKDVPFESEFYWKGKRYRKFIQPRPEFMPKKAFKIPCYLVREQAYYIDMPSGREVKPMVRYGIFNTGAEAKAHCEQLK